MDPSDGELLAEFARTGSQAAFAALVNRHGRMVHAVCQRALTDHHEAQDVTQAVFLVLARRAVSLRKDASVAGWLHTVARRLALNTRLARERRQQREQTAMSESSTTVSASVDAEGFWGELDAALGQLPERYRQPLVLFHLEGQSVEQTSQTLGLNANTLCTRLARARELLRKKLVRRGVTVGSVGALTALLSAEAGAAALPATIVSATVKAAGLAAAGKLAAGVSAGTVSAHVAALTKGALNMLFWNSVKTAALTALCIGVVGTVAVVAQQGGAPKQTSSWVTKPDGQVDINPLWGAFDRLDQSGELVITVQSPAGQSGYRPPPVELRLKIADGREEIVRKAAAGLAKGAKVKVGCVWSTNGRERFVWELAAM